MEKVNITLGSVIYCCKGCEERKVGCHGYCERYKKQRKKQNQINHLRKMDNLTNSITIEQVKECKERVRRK